MQKGSYLFQTLLASNALVAFGSDWPVRTLLNAHHSSTLTTLRGDYILFLLILKFQVADIDPLNSIKTAVKRIPPGWDNAWNPAECMKLTDALNAYVDMT